MNILVAEDNPVNQKLLRLMLEMHGHNVLVTPDGKEAVAVYQSDEIDLVLMDVQMPGMNGFEATTTIRELEKIPAPMCRSLPLPPMSCRVIRKSASTRAWTTTWPSPFACKSSSP